MKSIKTLTLILAIAAAQMMTSCLKTDEQGYKIQESYPELFNAITDANTGEMTIYPGQSIKVDWLYGANTATIYLNGLKLPGGVSCPMLEFKSKPFGVNSRGWLEIAMKNTEPDAVSGYVPNLIFDSFNFQTINRQYAHNGQTLNFPPVVSCKYTLNNGQYSVVSLQSEIIEMGESVITDQEGNQYKPSNQENLTIYYIELDPVTMKGYIVIQGAKFDKNMPAMNMKFPNIDFEVSRSGTITMHSDELTPTLMSGNDITAAGTPAPQFPITNLNLTYTPERGVQLVYNCVPTGKDGQPMGKYTVNFTSTYTEASSSTNK